MAIYDEPRLLPCGDRAVSVELGDEISREVNARVLALDYLIRQDTPPGVTETVPSYRALLVYYDPAAVGFDGLPADEVVRLHSSVAYRVDFVGFTPGLPYLSGMPERLFIPRLEQPRVKTPPGSVSIGGMQCCIYSVESPGGFWVLGRTPVRLYDPTAVDPILLRAGDRVRFRVIHRGEFDAIAAAVAAGSYKARLDD